MRFIFACCFLAVALPVFAGTADEDYAAWMAAYRQSPPRDKADRTKEQVDQFWRDKFVEVDALSAKFVAAHPDDPRRWEVMLRPIQMARWRSAASDGERRAAEDRDLRALESLIAAADVRDDLIEQARGTYTQLHLERALAAHHRGDKVDWKALAEKMDDLATRHPASRARAAIERRYLDLLSEADPAVARVRMEKLLGDSNPTVAETAKALLAKAGYLGRELEMKFTSADGREVDLAALRGKVVLIDFWATWCGPCMNEMPNVKAAYAKYRDQGFEVIGVSLDGGGITKGIQSGVKTRDDFLAFLQREQMPWPQHYDNLGWKNEFAQKYGIKSIPAVFLLDRSGRVISTELRGEGFDHQIGKALK